MFLRLWHVAFEVRSGEAHHLWSTCFLRPQFAQPHPEHKCRPNMFRSLRPIRPLPAIRWGAGDVQLVVSINRAPQDRPQYYHPYNGDLQTGTPIQTPCIMKPIMGTPKGPPNFWKPPTALLSQMRASAKGSSMKRCAKEAFRIQVLPGPSLYP